MTIGHMMFAAQAARGKTPSLPAIVYGQNASHDAGTGGTMFVDAVNGSNLNSGLAPSSAKATIGAAVAAAHAARGAQVIRVMGHGVKYRETIDYIWSGNAPTSLKIAAYGTDRPIISGANVLTGWSPCNAADAPLVGSNFGFVYKTTVSKSQFPAPKYWATFMSENGEPLVICGLRRAARIYPDFFFDNIEQGIRASEDPTLVFGLRNNTWYDTITHPAGLSTFSDAQLQQTTAALYCFPNITLWQEVTSATNGVLKLEARDYRPNGTGQGRYALLNLLPNIQRGQWGYRDNGDGTVTFYVWPNNPENLFGNMELAVRQNGMRIYRSLSNTPLEIEGINFEMFARAENAGYALSLDGLSPLIGNTARVSHCMFRHFASEKAFEVKFQAQAVTVEYCTFESGAGFGLQTSGGTGQALVGYRVRNCLAKDLSQTGFRMFNLHQCVMTDNRAVRTSGGGHANAINFYSGCDKCVIVNFQGGASLENRLYEGYGTNQRASNIYWLHCTFTPGRDGRAYVDQTNPTTPNQPVPGEGGGLINCWVPDMADRRGPSSGSGGITVGRPTVPWALYNNVAPAIVNTGGTLTRRGNVLTYSVSTADSSETLANLNSLFTNPASYDWTAKGGSALKTMTGVDCTAIISLLESWFPDENFRRDALNRAWNPATPGVGPFGLGWDTASAPD